MPRGGKRENTGPKPTGRRKRQFYITDAEHAQVRELIKKMREAEKNER